MMKLKKIFFLRGTLFVYLSVLLLVCLFVYKLTLTRQVFNDFLPFSSPSMTHDDDQIDQRNGASVDDVNDDNGVRVGQGQGVIVGRNGFFPQTTQLNSHNETTTTAATTDTLQMIIQKGEKRTESTRTNEKSLSNQCQVTIVIILCNDDDHGLRNKHNQTISSGGTARNFQRQINQTIVLLKSITIQQRFAHFEKEDDLTPSQDLHTEKDKLVRNQCVNVLVLSDDKKNYLQLLRIITEEEKWSSDFVNLLNFTFVPVRYPPGSQWMKKLFRPCATLRLFLAELLPDYDSVIYLDTDIIFLRSLTSLWKEFESFDVFDSKEEDEMKKKTKLAGMTECLFHYDKSSKIPYYGKTGLNAGVALMNLTRMRNSGWTNKIRLVTSNFQKDITLADQDILNIFFHYHPDELHQLSCDWNFRPFQCRPGSFCQDLSLTTGISALHGNALSFTHQGPEPLFHTVFSVFQKLSLTTKPLPLSLSSASLADPSINIIHQLFHTLQSHLQITQQRRMRRPQLMTDCMRYGAFNILVLNRLDKIRKKIHLRERKEKVYHKPF